MSFQSASPQLCSPPADGFATQRLVRICCALIVLVATTGTAFYARTHGHDRSFILGLGVVACSVAVLCASCHIGRQKKVVSAGRGWFSSNDGFVRTDRLTELRVRVILSGTYVSLRDAEGRHVDIPLCELTDDPQVWQFVLAGIKDSLASGLAVDGGLTASVFCCAQRRVQSLGSFPVTPAPSVFAPLTGPFRYQDRAIYWEDDERGSRCWSRTTDDAAPNICLLREPNRSEAV